MTTQDTWERHIEHAWTALRNALTAWLEQVPPDGHVIIEMPWPDHDIAGAAPYVQLAIDGYSVRSEAVSNAFLDPRFRLDDHRAATLLARGWQQPTATMSEATTNYWHDDELPEDAAALAERLVIALRDIFGVPDPSFLVASGFDDGPWADTHLPLGLRVTHDHDNTDEPVAVFTQSPDELRDHAATAVQHVTRQPAVFDADGDIPVAAATTTVYVRVDEDNPSIRLFALLLHEVPWKPRVGHEINASNRGIGYAHLTYDQGNVLLTYQLWCRPFVPEHLKQAVAGMRALADDLPTRLQNQIGGRLVSDASDAEDGAA